MINIFITLRLKTKTKHIIMKKKKEEHKYICQDIYFGTIES